MLRFVHINQDLQMELSIAELGCDIKRFNVGVGGGGYIRFMDSFWKSKYSQR